MNELNQIFKEVDSKNDSAWVRTLELSSTMLYRFYVPAGSASFFGFVEYILPVVKQPSLVLINAT